MRRAFEIHFFETKSGHELVETRFRSTDGWEYRCVRGKTAGAFRGNGSFQWTSAVRAIAALSLRHAIHPTIPSVPQYISGGRASLAASLDYAITKVPFWIEEMFGALQNGQIAARRLFLITNPNQKRPGPVTISINASALSPSDIRVYLNGSEVSEATALVSILAQIDIPPRELAGAGQTGWEKRTACPPEEVISP
jgi:hypothetical protein